MSLIELKLTMLEDYCKRNEQRWFTEYVREHWKFDFKEGDIMNTKKYEYPICPICGSRNVTARLKTKTFWCRRCMHIGKREEFFKDEHKKSKD